MFDNNEEDGHEQMVCKLSSHGPSYRLSTFDHTLKDDEGGFSLQVSVFHQTSLGRRAVS